MANWTIQRPVGTTSEGDGMRAGRRPTFETSGLLPGSQYSGRLSIPALIEHFCVRNDLSTYDPYDIWKTSLGFQIKNLYNHRPRFGLIPAAVLALFDDLVNNNWRLFY